MDSPAKFEVNGHTYQAARMDVFRQFHVARRLGPILTNIAQAVRDHKEVLSTDPATISDPWAALSAMTDVLGKMSDADLNYVIDSCLHVVKRQDGDGWQVVRAGGQMMYDDIDLPTMLQIVFRVLEANLGNFFSANPSSFLAAAGRAPAIS